MQKLLLVAACLLALSMNAATQSWKKTAQSFTVFQDDNKTHLFTLQVPEESKINPEFNFAMYITGKTNLSLSYDLDEEPAIRKEADLAAYAKKLTNTDIAGTEVTLSNKKMAVRPETINGIKTFLIQYDYVKKGGTQKASEKGKVFLYLIPVKGTSLINDNEHLMMVRLSFDYNQTSGNIIDMLYKEIMTTLQPDK